ncbi:MAG: hypothetical protein ACRCZC_00175, partial [Culicoidibacterales bacterium]
GRSYELVLSALIERLRNLRATGYQFKIEPTLIFQLIDQGQEIDLATYLLIDENTIYYYVMMLTQEFDSLLVTIANSFLNRQLLQYCVDEDGSRFMQLQQLCQQFAPELLLLCSRDEALIQQPYQYYQSNQSKNIVPLEFVLPTGALVDIAEISPIVRALSQESFKGECLLFYPLEQLQQAVQGNPIGENALQQWLEN